MSPVGHLPAHGNLSHATRRHNLSSLCTQSSVPPPKSRGGACLAARRHKDHTRRSSGLWLRWGLDTHGQRTALKLALARDNPRGLVTVWPPRVHTLLHNFAGRSMESMATKGMAHSGSAEATPSQQGTRKSNGTNAAPSCQAKSYVAMQHVSG